MPTQRSRSRAPRKNQPSIPGVSASTDLVEFDHELCPKFKAFYVDRWCPIRHPFDPNEEGSEARAIELVQANILDVFKGDFAPFAFEVATQVGLHRFPSSLPDPPLIRDTAPSKNVSNDAILQPMDLTGAPGAKNAGFLIIAWGAIYHDPQRWDKIKSYRSVIDKWAQDGFVCRWEPEPDGRLVRRTFNQPFADMVQPALRMLLEGPEWNPAEQLIRARQGADPAGAVVEPSHSPDFRSVNWYGARYLFTENQAACVAVLWKAWENGTPEVGDRTLLAMAEISSERLDATFRDCDAWGAMIVQGATKGTRKLQKPSSSPA